MSAFARLVARDLRLALRQRADAGMVVLFFVLTAALFPLAVGPEPNLLARMAPGIICADEPIASLDEENARAVMDLLFEIAGEAGSTLLTVTHDPIFIDRLDVVHHMVLGKFTDGSGDVRAEAIGGGAS